MSDPISDPMNPIIENYVEPTCEELRARKKRNRAIAIGLLGWVGLVFWVMLLKMGYFK